MVWCGIVNGYLIGSYFFDRNVDRDSYLESTRNHLPVRLENVDLPTRVRMWLQQDSAALQFELIVRQFLNYNYNSRRVDEEVRLNAFQTL
ncbi:hypothetical protein TSAR_003246 [Trichomalopsis sarcophagae]|uniref:Uncharacterized protein n=1 Tax=Trichomalopsis sarcophagae TaxID=543379 RepID=A0A232EQQ6_9HYME|nr:hypothetical protein TSAR_003246 [Trichomalopsis sarcophagae]